MGRLMSSSASNFKYSNPGLKGCKYVKEWGWGGFCCRVCSCGGEVGGGWLKGNFEFFKKKSPPFLVRAESSDWRILPRNFRFPARTILTIYQATSKKEGDIALDVNISAAFCPVDLSYMWTMYTIQFQCSDSTIVTYLLPKPTSKT